MALEVIKEGGPAVGDVHVPTAGAGQKKPLKAVGPEVMLAPGRPLQAIEDEMEAQRRHDISKAAPEPSPLYVCRKLLNADEVIAWAKKAGFATTYSADEMHVTVTLSKNPVDWMAMGPCWDGDQKGNLEIPPGGPRQLARFGPTENCAVLIFGSSALQWRHQQMIDQGASWDFDCYYPHIAISQDIGDMDLSQIQPYQGALKFGPELFGPVKEKAMAGVVEKREFETFFKVAGVDEELGLVIGWGIVCTEHGQDYYDLQKNHVPEDAMLAATLDFMKSARVHGDMHDRGTAPSDAAGEVVFGFPMTAAIWKAMFTDATTGAMMGGLPDKPPKTGFMVGTSPDKSMLAKFKSGEYTGFSIGGEYIEIDGQPVSDVQRAA